MNTIRGGGDDHDGFVRRIRGETKLVRRSALWLIAALLVSLGTPTPALSRSGNNPVTSSTTPGAPAPQRLEIEKPTLPATPDAAARMTQAAPASWITHRDFDAAPGDAEVTQGHPVEYLLLDYQAHGFDAPEYFTRVVARLLTTDGVDQFGEISVSFDPSCQSLVWHRLAVVRDGAVLDQLDLSRMRLLQREEALNMKLYDGSVTAIAVLEDLRPGDIVEYAYTIVGESPIFGGRLVVSYYPAMSEPVREFAARVVDRADRKLVQRSAAAKLTPLFAKPAKAKAPEFAVRTTPAGREYTWSAKNIAPIDEESDVPEWYDPWPRLELSQYADWAEVVRWAIELYELPEGLPPAVEELVARWEKELPDRAARAEAAVRFVQDEIRYLGIETGENSHRPHPPAWVFARRFGDCKDKTTFAVALLRRLGVPAWPALILSTGGPEIPTHAPSPFVFDHAIVAYELGGKVHFVDPTLQRQGGALVDSAVPPYDWTLLVRDGEKALTKIPRSDSVKPLRSVLYRFDLNPKNYSARLSIETECVGSEADTMREDVATTPRSRLAQRFLNYYAKKLPGIELAGEPTWIDDRAANRFVMRETYTVSDLWPQGDDNDSREPAVLEPYEFSESIQMPDLPRRRTPLALDWPVHLRETLEFNVPGGWDNLNANFDQTTDVFACTGRRKVEGTRLTLEFTLKHKTDAVSPTGLRAYIRTMRETYDQMSELSALKVRKIER